MTPFLQKLATQVYHDYSDLKKVCIVFQNRRAVLYFRKYLAQLIQKPVWLPEIISIEDMVSRYSGLKIADQLTLSVFLYESYKEIEKGNPWPFADFLSWGKQLLSDFDEIDQYLVNGEAVFKTLDEIKALKNWNPEGTELTKSEHDYLQFYNSLARYYSIFRDKLIDAGLAYAGLSYRHLLDNIQLFNHEPWDKFIFAGFNAITPAEKALADHLKSFNKVEFIWDADEYYVNDKSQEAGYFLRHNLNIPDLKDLKWIDTHYRGQDKQIIITGIPGNIGQVKYAGQLLSAIQSIKNEAEERSTAIVLVDESLLVPLLNSLSPSSTSYNVTMGYPSQNSSVFSLIDDLLTLFANSTTHPADTNGISFFLRSDILRVINHPLLNILRKSKRIEVSNSPFVPLKDFPSILKTLFPDFNMEHYLPGDQAISVENVISLIYEVLEQLLKVNSNDNLEVAQQSGNVVIEESTKVFLLLLDKLAKINKDHELRLNIKSLKEVITMLSASLTIPFYGEPLSGIQIMGMLETRTLDFDNVIMLSCNEDILPKGKSLNTFIPLDIRREFKLPSYRENNAIIAYHFYRLMQRASNVWLLYNSEPGTLGGGEESRFIKQLTYEMSLYNTNLTISHQVLSYTFDNDRLQGLKEIRVEKNEFVLQKLESISEKGFSPTSLSTYLDCPLKFYFSRILKIEEPDEPGESLDDSLLGQAVHAVLKEIYEPFISLNGVDIEKLKEARRNVNTLLDQKLNSLLDPVLLKTGQNLLTVRIAEKMIRNILKQDILYLEELAGKGSGMQIIATEETLKKKLGIQTPGNKERDVWIKGTLDRVDSVGNQVRIIDYKTGKVENKDLKINNAEEVILLDNPAKAFQLLTYGWLIASNNEKVQLKEELVCGIIAAKRVKGNFLPLQISDQSLITPEIIDETTFLLTGLITEIFDPSIAFIQADNPVKCKYCPYCGICNR